MDNAPGARRALFAALYFLTCAGILLLQILPTSLLAGRYPGPDLMLCVTFAWVMRRPHQLPTGLVALTFLLADIILMRPPGLWAALVVIAVEYLRAREQMLRELPVAAEFGTVAVAVVFVPLAYHLVLILLAVPQVGFGLTVLQTIATLIAYPIFVTLLRLMFGIDRLQPGGGSGARRLQ